MRRQLHSLSCNPKARILLKESKGKWASRHHYPSQRCRERDKRKRQVPLESGFHLQTVQNQNKPGANQRNRRGEPRNDRADIPRSTASDRRCYRQNHEIEKGKWQIFKHILQLKLDIIASGTYGGAIRAVEIPDLASRPKEENRAFDRPRFYRARSELCNEIRIHRVRIVTCYFHSSTGSNFIQRKKTSWSCIYA